MNNSLIEVQDSTIKRTQTNFNTFQMFSSKRDIDNIINLFSTLCDNHMDYNDNIYKNLKKSEKLSKEGNDLLELLSEKFKLQIDILICKQNILYKEVLNYNQNLKNNNLKDINLIIYDKYINNLKGQINLISNKDNIVNKIIKDNSINNINIEIEKCKYYNSLINLNNSILKIKDYIIKLKNKKTWDFYSKNEKIQHPQFSEKYKSNFPLIGEKNIQPKKVNFNYNHHELVSKDSKDSKDNNSVYVVTDIYISNEDKLFMVINGIVYRNNSHFYIVDQRHLYEIKDIDLKN